MARSKSPMAQAGTPHWRHAPDDDPHMRPQAQSLRAALQGQAAREQRAPAHELPVGAATHFPQDAFRRLNNDQHAQARPTYFPQQDMRTAPPPSFDRSRSAPPAQDGPYLHNGVQNAWPPQQDPSAYDLAHYSPPGGNADPGLDPYAAQNGHLEGAAADGWTGAGWNQHGYQPQFADPPAGTMSPYDHPAQGHYPDDPYGDGGRDYIYEEAPEDEHVERRGPRAFVIAAALVGAIGIGGGLAYSYKTFYSGGSGATPVVRADKAPSKSKPADPGGREIAHTDKKFLNRLGEDRSGAQASAITGGAPVAGEASQQSEPDVGPRKVTTLTVNRDGTMVPPNPIVPQPQSGGSVGTSGVPGLLVDGLGPRPQLRPAQSEAQPPVQAAPIKPKVVARAEVTAEPEPVAETPKKPVQREEAAAPSRQPQAPVKAASVTSGSSPVTGNGFVPVLSSQKSRMDALKAFADIQQKYSDVVANHTPDVREVNLGEKGVWHRLVLGPPGSREAANTVCTQLKAAGYSSCWITVY